MSTGIEIIKNPSGITDVPGFEAAGVACDIREIADGRLDMGLIYSKERCSTAGVFTKNDVKAAPVILGQETLNRDKGIHAVIINSGNANACTGKQGFVDCEEMLNEGCRKLKIGVDNILVASTGRIGRLMPMANIKKGIALAVEAKSAEAKSGHDCATAILTSDTCSKLFSVKFDHEGKAVHLGGIVKGAGMIQPDMATMLAFIVSDIKSSSTLLHSMLSDAVGSSFNSISIDGDMSTNDTVLLLGNGVSGVDLDLGEEKKKNKFLKALRLVSSHLAEKIVADGERITKVVNLSIKNAKEASDAEKVARCVANSLLVKTSWFGSDPNWGRLIDAAGYAMVGIEVDKLDVYYDDILIFQQGEYVESNLLKCGEIVSRRKFSITLDLNIGKSEFEMLTTDLSMGYVDFNKSE